MLNGIAREGARVNVHPNPNPNPNPNCGNNSHLREQCPARNVTCFACQKVGHFSAHCRSRQSKMDLVMEETHLDSAFLGPIGQTSWTVDIVVNGVFLTFKVDTGAEVTAISEQAYRTLGTICKLEKTSKTLFGPTKISLHVMGQMQATPLETLSIPANKQYML